MNILLVHGLGRTPYSLASLGKYLQHQGHYPYYFGYAAFAQSYDHIVMRLRQRLTTKPFQTAPYAIVAHSLGGLLSRSALGDRSLPIPTHFIMLGTPNQSPLAARWAWRLPPFQWFAQDCGHKLASPSFYTEVPSPHFDYHIIAGTGGWTGTMSPFGEDANDGLVTLKETCINPSDRPFTFPVFHTFMMNNPSVQQTIAKILESPSYPQGSINLRP